MRTGFATSACAAAAAAAAARILINPQPIDEIVIDLPKIKKVPFHLIRCEIGDGSICCGVIKDGGDDPDVTNGLEIQAIVRWCAEPGIKLMGGAGVGRVTLPGLSVPVGEAAINPGPRKLILQVFQTELKQHQIAPGQGFEIIIQVPNGEEVAAKTMNPKLGIRGGISILGTDGLVRPYSAPAFRTSLFYELRVAFENGYSSVGLVTGKRSNAYLQTIMEDERGLGVIDVGDELGYPIDQAARMGFKKLCVGGMIGKLSKLAQGRFQTHVQDGEIDFDFLAFVAGKQGASSSLCDQIRIARTAHQVQNWLKNEAIQIEPGIAKLAAEQVSAHLNSRLDVAVYLFSLDGSILGQSEIGAAHEA